MASSGEVFVKPEPPTTSWWLAPAFQRGGPTPVEDAERMKRSGKQTGGETRIVGTVNGKAYG